MLSQIGRGAVLLTSMALVACYIDVYATGKFPWQHAPAEALSTVPPSEFVNDPAVQPAQYPTQEQRLFMAGSKSDVAASAIVVQSPTANAQTTTTATTAAPLFLSGSKSFTGQTTVLSGTLNTPPANSQSDPQAPSFMGGSKTIMLPTRLPESATQPAPNAAAPQQFMSGFKSPGPAVMSGTSLPTLPQSAPPGNSPPTYPQSPSANNQSFQPNVSPQQDKPSANGTSTNNAKPPLFMSGAKSPLRHSDIPSASALPQQQQQAAPPKIVPPNAPNSPAGSY